MHMLPWAHPSPQPKRHFDWFSHFCTAHGRVSSGMPGHDLPPKLPLCMGICSLQTIPILYNESPFSPKKLPLPIGWSGPHLIYIPWSHPRSQPKQHLDRFRRFCTPDCRVFLNLQRAAALFFTISRVVFIGGRGMCPGHCNIRSPTRVKICVQGWDTWNRSNWCNL